MSSSTTVSAAHQHQLSAATVAAVAATSGALAFGLVYWHVRVRSGADPSDDGNSTGSTANAAATPWHIAWPRARRRQAAKSVAAAAAAAERLSTLARTNDAIESAAQEDTLLKASSLASLGSSDAGAAAGAAGGANSQAAFGEGDLAALVMCTRKNGARWVLGGASAGQVFRALRGGETPIALREFRYELSAEEDKQLQRLVARLSRSGSRHVVKPLGCARIPGPGGGYYIAAPLYERGSLADVLAGPRAGEFLWYKRSKAGGGREAGAGRQIALAVARGLHWLHTNGIVHLDLRPSKVLLGDGGEARLADAGLAAFMHHDYMAAKASVGPFSWTAPEVMYGEPGSASPPADIWSFGVLLWQLISGGDPMATRQRFVSGGKDAPQAVVDLMWQCMDRHINARPSTGEIVALLSRPEHELPAALRSRPGTQPPAGSPIGEEKTKQGVWNAATTWIYTTYGSREKAHAAGYEESPVERILEAREWDAYAHFISCLRELLQQADVRTPGSPSYRRLLQLYRLFHSHTNFKLAATAEEVREQRFRNMESLESLDSLASEVPAEEPAGAASTAAPSVSLRSTSGGSQAKQLQLTQQSASAPSPGTTAAAAPTVSANSANSGSSDDSAQRRQENIASRLDLTPDQIAAILLVREEFRQSQRATVRERNALVKQLHDFAVGASSDSDRALAASAALRRNIFEEGRQLHSYHMCSMWECLSPWQFAQAERVAALGGGLKNSTYSTWQGIVQEGEYYQLRCDPDNVIR